MFLQTYGVALLVIGSSIALGQAICSLAGARNPAWAAPMVGLAGLIIVAGATIKLPGHATTADVLTLLLVVAALVYLALSRRWPIGATQVAVLIFTILVVSIPFLANGRVGLQGVSLDNDTAAHLVWAEDVRSPQMASLWGIAAGYPLGPHSLVAAIGTALGIPLDAVFTGFLIAIAPITALAGMGVLDRQATSRRMVVGVFCALTFLVAAYYGEGAFKETLMAGLVLTFVVHLEEVRRHWDDRAGVRRWLTIAPLSVLVAGAVYSYSYLAFAWFGATIGIWAIAELATCPVRSFRWVSRRNVLPPARALVLILAGLVVLLLPIAGQIRTFFHGLGAAPTSLPAPLGNLAGPVPPSEMFGISLNPDFRFVINTLHAGEVAAFATGVVVYGFLWCLRRRDLLLPAAAGGAIVLWWIAHRGPSPYVAAKALVIASPLLMAVALKALFTSRPAGRAARLVRAAIAIAFCALAAYSTVRSLRDAPVQAPVAGQNLEAFHHLIGRAPVLFLGFDDYAGWLLRDAPVGDPTGATAGGVVVVPRPEKPPGPYGQAVDFDSMLPSDLDRFAYVVTSHSAYNSQPYANFRLVGTGRFYELWQRTGPTVSRQVFEPPGAPGAVLNCRRRRGRRLRRERGVASIFPTPPIVMPGPYLRPGRSASLALRLPAGRWQLSIQYGSAMDLDYSSVGLHGVMPAYLGRLGPFFALGAVEGRGVKNPVILDMRAQRPSPLTSLFDNLSAQIAAIAATRLPNTPRVVPLSQACGRYVDWYRPTSGGP